MRKEQNPDEHQAPGRLDSHMWPPIREAHSPRRFVVESRPWRWVAYGLSALAVGVVLAAIVINYLAN